MKSTTTSVPRLRPDESGDYNGFRMRMATRIVQNGGTEEDVLRYWEHLDEKPGVADAIRTPVDTEQEIPSWLGVPMHFVQGVTFGFGDEAIGTISGMLSRGMSNQEGRDAYRAVLQQYQQQNPGTTIATQIAGVIALGLATAGTSATAGIARAVGTQAVPGMAAGAGAAALQGAGQATGGVGTRIEAATQAGPLAAGAVAGGLAGPFGRGVSRATGAVARGVRHLAGRASGLDELAEVLPGSPSRQALLALRNALAKDGITPSQAAATVRARMAQGLPTTIGDIGGPHTGALITNAQLFQGPVQQQFAQMVRSRAIQADPRALAAIGRDMRVGSQNAYAAVRELTAQQALEADPFYQRAYQETVRIGPKIRSMLSLPDFRRAYDAGRNLSLMDDAAGVDRGLAIPDLGDDLPESLPVRALDYIKKGIQHLAETGGGEGKSAISHEAARSMRAVMRNALTEIDDQVPVYRLARNTWRGFEDAMDAVAQGYGGNLERGQLTAGGRGFLTKKLDEVAREFAATPDDLKPYYRLGVLESLADALHGPGQEAATAMQGLGTRRLFSDRALRLKVAVLFEEPAMARQFLDRVAGEAAWLRMTRAARPMTPNAERATDVLLPQGMVGTMARRAGVGRNVSRGQMLGDEIALLFMQGLDDPRQLESLLRMLPSAGALEQGIAAGGRVAAGQQVR